MLLSSLIQALRPAHCVGVWVGYIGLELGLGGFGLGLCPVRGGGLGTRR